MNENTMTVDFENMHYGFIGLGLIGGSIARALREKYPSCMITAFDMEPSAVEAAKRDGVVTICAYEIDRVFTSCDLIFLCAPVSCNDSNLLFLQKVLGKNTLLTDVGSVKSGIYEHIKAAGLEKQFIGGHPMAGSERTGYQNSRAMLLENAYYILTPTEKTPAEKTKLMETLVKSLGAIPLVLSAAEHDYVTAGISHLPHVISASLVNLVKNKDNADGMMKLIAAGGFKDITRISSSSPVMWEHICMANRDNILSLLDSYMESLQDIKKRIAAQDASGTYAFFESARSYRESFTDVSGGPIKKSHVFYVDIPDEPGALATIVTLLAFQQINLKNIGITHNREVAEGSLLIEVWKEADIARAQDVLSAKGYVVRVKK